MINIDIDNTVIMAQQRRLEALLSTNPDTEKALRRLIRKEILKARKKVVSSIGLKNDPRGAANSVRTVVYKAVLGANINIYNNRRAHGNTSYRPSRKLDANPHQHGGNRRKRSMRTEQIMNYGPLDRGFILRFINQGTKTRSTIYGNRGSIPSGNFFMPAANTAMAQAISNLSTLIEDELQNILSKTKN